MDPLDLKHAKSVLIFLSSFDVAKKSDLAHIVKSHQVLDNLLSALVKGGYLRCDSTLMGPKKYSISLTNKGSAVAEQLKRVNEVAAEVFLEQEKRIIMPPHWRDRYSGLSTSTERTNIDCCVVKEADGFGKTIKEAVLRMRVVDDRPALWCETDESSDCVHVDYAWSLPSIRELFGHFVLGVNDKTQ